VRLGGEEFALMVPISRHAECTPEQLLLAVRNRAMPLGIKVTTSIGFADGRVDSDEGWRKLYRLADSALYRAKSDGRDRACRATDFTKIAAA
jgi:diguanylate cyclase (GGDEF)-like protein